MDKVLRVAGLVAQLELVWVEGDDLSPGPGLDPIKIGLKDLHPDVAEKLKKQVEEFGAQSLKQAEAPQADPATNGQGPTPS